MRTRSLLRPLTVAVCVTTTVGLVSASTPTFWQVATQADFLKGEVVENISIDDDGRLVLGPLHRIVYEATAPFLWSGFVDDQGRLVVGSGNDGKVLRIAPDGKDSVLLDTAELDAQAVAPGPGGSLYAATSPDGKVYRIAADGTTTTVFDPDDRYLWSLAVAPDGTLFVGTGDKGIVYRVSADGKSSPFVKTSATNVTALAFDAQGHLLAGTESPGRVLRIGADGRAFVLLDSPYREIRRLRMDSRGNIYAVAVSGREPETRGPDRQPPEPQPTTTVTPSVSTEITITAIGDVAVPSTSGVTPRPESRKENKGAVYRIAPDGLWDIAWESTEDSPYDVAFGESEALLIATGPQGKIFRVTGEPARTTLLARAAAKQVTTLVRGREGALFSLASNPGKVYRLSSEPAERGVYESDVRDAGTVATWGAIRWHATTPPGSSVEISTRAGNTGRPDETWSDWSPGYRTATGEPIASPKARYLQWRAVLAAGKGASPVLTSVTAAYLPRNIRPEVDGITVHPPGTVFQRPFSTGEAELAGYDGNTSDGRPLTPVSSSLSTFSGPVPTLGRRTYQKGLQTFVWKASDANDDKLQYDVFYRREGDVTWRPLKPGLWDEILTWDTTSVPDGTYTIKVVASDAPSNAPAAALSGELESISFDIDNTPPEITFTGTPGSPRRLTFTVRDEQSVVQRVEYSLDASRWRVVYPMDGLADSRVETLEIALPADADPNNVIVRATDALNNVATAVVRSTR